MMMGPRPRLLLMGGEERARAADGGWTGREGGMPSTEWTSSASKRRIAQGAQCSDFKPPPWAEMGQTHHRQGLEGGERERAGVFERVLYVIVVHPTSPRMPFFTNKSKCPESLNVRDSHTQLE